MVNSAETNILIIDLEWEYELRTLAVMSGAYANRRDNKF